MSDMAHQPSIGGLATKLALAMGAISGIEKDKEHTGHHYTYSTADAMFAAVRLGLAQAGIAFLPQMGQIEQTPIDKGGIRTRVQFTYMFIDGETGETLSSYWVGEADDYPGDKGITKASTLGLKSFLKATFLLSSADDNTSEGTNKRNTSGNRQQPPPPREGMQSPQTSSSNSIADGTKKTFTCAKLLVIQSNDKLQYIAKCEGNQNIVSYSRDVYRAAKIIGVELWDLDVPKAGKTIEFKPALQIEAHYVAKTKGWEIDTVIPADSQTEAKVTQMSDIPEL